MKLCISQTTTLSTPFQEDIEAHATGGWNFIEVWMTKLETHLSSNSIRETKSLLETQSIEIVAAAYQGGLLLSQGEARKAHFEDFRKRLLLCSEFQIPSMLLVADFTQRIDQTSLERAIVSLKQAAQLAQAVDVSLALEFRGSDTFCSTLPTASLLVEQAQEPNLSVNLDLFHFYKGASKLEDLELLSANRIGHVQFSDVAGIPRELMTDSDRIMPGDGDFRFDLIMGALRRIGYDGIISIEVPNPIFWQMKPSQVSELAYTALSRVVQTGS